MALQNQHSEHQNNIYPFAPGASSSSSESFVFVTDGGWFYTIEFFKSLSRFEENSLLMNNGLVYEIIIGRSPIDDESVKCLRNADMFIRPTIQAILNNFILTKGFLPIYYFICDPLDCKDAARSKVFKDWFNNADLGDWELINYQVIDDSLSKNEAFYTIYAGMLINTQNPSFEEYPTAFENFLQEQAAQGKLINSSL